MNILFFHKSNSIYLPFTLSQVQESNPKANIVLLGDDSNDKYSFVLHENISDYSKSASEFEKIYKHMSLTPYQFELICFLRWFVFRDYLYEKDYEGEFICLDSDLLVYEDINKMHGFFEGYDITVRGNGGAGFQWFKNKEVLDDFCNFIKMQYTNSELFQRLELNWIEHQKLNFGGICDMTMFNFYLSEGYYKVCDISSKFNNILVEKALTDIADSVLIKGSLRVFKSNYLPYFLKSESLECIYIGSLHHNSDKARIYKLYYGDRFKRKKYIMWFKDIVSNIRCKLIIRTRIKRMFTSNS
ncbi:MAG: hypothetical protein WCK02_08905 [Bacteroidota bacterium]